jgi:hypothetical protein
VFKIFEVQTGWRLVALEKNSHTHAAANHRYNHSLMWATARSPALESFLRQAHAITNAKRFIFKLSPIHK